MTFKDFEKSAPSLSLKLFESKTNKKASSSSSSGATTESEILALELSKTEMSTGSYGYSASGKKIKIEVEVDGKKQKVSAVVRDILFFFFFSSAAIPCSHGCIFAGLRQYNCCGFEEGEILQGQVKRDRKARQGESHLSNRR